MLRSQVITGLEAIRHELEKHAKHCKIFLSENTADWYDEVLVEARRAVLLNEQNDPYAKY
jgi:hypothetical protein